MTTTTAPAASIHRTVSSSATGPAPHELALAQVMILGSDMFDSSRAYADEIAGVTDVEIPGVSKTFATTERSVIGMAMGSSYLQVSYIPPGPGTVLEATTQTATIAAANFSG